MALVFLQIRKIHEKYGKNSILPKWKIQLRSKLRLRIQLRTNRQHRQQPDDVPTILLAQNVVWHTQTLRRR
jgi:hypothetical protein